MMTIWTIIQSIPDETARSIVENVFLTYEDRMMRIALNVLHNEFDAQDAVQNAIYRIIIHAEDFQDVYSDSVAALVSTYAKNAALNVYRRNKNFSEHCELYEDMSDSNLEDEDEDLPKWMMDRENSELVDRALESLDSKYREVLMLKYFRSFKNDRIAEILNIEYTQVGGRLFRARKQLSTVLEGMGYDRCF